jgi:FKBP-type peptidyl-prolyl cis-trans isomerase
MATGTLAARVAAWACLRGSRCPIDHTSMTLRLSSVLFTTALGFTVAGGLLHAFQQPRPAAQPIPAPADVAAPPADATKTASGLATKVLQKGTGDKTPGATDMVTVHYTGWTTDGKMFDSSYSRAKPNTFGVNQVIKGWGEGVQLMVVGEKRRLWIPEALAYQGKPDRPKGMLVFDIELLEISSSPTVAPPDVAAPPADAKKTSSGLAYKVLKPGTGSSHPNSRSRVTVHYTGWTTDGKMFDSSIVRNAPATFGLDEVIPGWTEGVQLMVEGEKTRFWIPQRLAYDGKQGAPRGMLVFDIELIRTQ